MTTHEMILSFYLCRVLVLGFATFAAFGKLGYSPPTA